MRSEANACKPCVGRRLCRRVIQFRCDIVGTQFTRVAAPRRCRAGADSRWGKGSRTSAPGAYRSVPERDGSQSCSWVGLGNRRRFSSNGSSIDLEFEPSNLRSQRALRGIDEAHQVRLVRIGVKRREPERTMPLVVAGRGLDLGLRSVGFTGTSSGVEAVSRSTSACRTITNATRL